MCVFSQTSHEVCLNHNNQPMSVRLFLLWKTKNCNQNFRIDKVLFNWFVNSCSVPCFFIWQRHRKRKRYSSYKSNAWFIITVFSFFYRNSIHNHTVSPTYQIYANNHVKQTGMQMKSKLILYFSANQLFTDFMFSMVAFIFPKMFVIRSQKHMSGFLYLQTKGELHRTMEPCSRSIVVLH